MGRTNPKSTFLICTILCSLLAPNLFTNWNGFVYDKTFAAQGKHIQHHARIQELNRSELAAVRRCDDMELQRIKASPFLATPVALMMESRCPNPLWLIDMLNLDYNISSSHTKRLLVSVGCNTALDAVETARDLSHNPSFNAQIWKESMQSVIGRPFQPVCSSAPQRSFTSDSPTILPIEIHCIEPIFKTIGLIQETAKRLGLDQNGFHAHQYVVSNSTGVIPFPVGRPGVEYLASRHCGQYLFRTRTRRRRVFCHDVPMLTLDDFATKHMEWQNRSDRMVDVLTIDTEGFDWRVLRGAGSVLARTRYLEFEYHDVWEQGELLKDAVDYLEELGFVCYFAGREGRLFKLTNGCWVNELHEVRVWSNVACVHRSEPTWLGIMEEYYQKTLLITT